MRAASALIGADGWVTPVVVWIGIVVLVVWGLGRLFPARPHERHPLRRGRRRAPRP